MLDAHRPRDKKGKRTEAVEEKSEDWIRKIRMGTFEDSGLCKGYVITFLTRKNTYRLIMISQFRFR